MKTITISIPFVVLLAVVILCVSFTLGVQYGKVQIVKQALSKIPHGKIDLYDKDNWKEFREKMMAGER